ncbi:MAG: hypothetical protein CMJ18_02070, partial [Phycisphaeraceae bacterium]|nr:hypothetical protein [Phycisphaeraceae bacterium]
VLERIPEDDRLILSFKVSHTDFWRYQKWNPCSLVCGDRPVIYELECQREFEAKGAIPNWQVPLWRDGCPEVDDEAGGLADVAQRVNLAGLWAWVRGGGWGGPFVSDETWIDANVYAVPILADDPAVDPAKLAQQWIGERLGIDDPDLAAALEQILMHSPQVVLQGFYIQSFVDTRKSTWHPNADWIQDDLLDVSAAWRVVQRIPESALDAAIREKRDAVNRIASDRQALQHAMTSENRTTLAPLLHTLEYGEALFCTLRDLLSGLIAYRRYQARRDPEIAKQCGKHLLSAQNHWNLHTGRTGSRSGAATAFREVGFWERTQQILAEVGSESN